MRSNLMVSSAMALISISSVSMISRSRIETSAWHISAPGKLSHGACRVFRRILLRQSFFITETYSRRWFAVSFRPALRSISAGRTWPGFHPGLRAILFLASKETVHCVTHAPHTLVLWLGDFQRGMGIAYRQGRDKTANRPRSNEELCHEHDRRL